MFGADPLRLAGIELRLRDLVHPAVFRGPGDLATGALVDDHVAHRVAAAERERFVDDRLQRQRLAAARLLVGRHDDDRAGIGDAVAQGLRREAAEHHRVHRAEPRAGLHRDHALDRHRHVDDDPVALLHAQALQRVGHAAGGGQQLVVGGARHRAVIGLEDDRHLVAQAGSDLLVQAVVRDVQGAVLEPLVERRLLAVQHLRERRFPLDEFARQPGPVAFVVGLGFGDQLVVGGTAGDVGTSGEGRRRGRIARWTSTARAGSCVCLLWMD